MPGRPLSMRPEWEDALREGRKTIDARLVADDIAGLEVGVAVRYPGARARVKRIRFYPGFGDLLAHEDWRRIAPDAADREEVRRLLEEGHEATVRPPAPWPSSWSPSTTSSSWSLTISSRTRAAVRPVATTEGED